MDTSTIEMERIEPYAQAIQHTVVSSQAELNPKIKPMVEMHAWCSKQQDIVVLTNGDILTSQPSSRSVQNCKIVMLNKGITPGNVKAATQDIVDLLLANSGSEQHLTQQQTIESVSEQQQRLRILVREAIIANASDIHLEVREHIARIRFRKHGELYLHAEWMPQLAREIASVAFNKETDHAIRHFNPRVPQDGSMSLRIDDKDIRLRLASIPSHTGFDVVMRVLTVGEDAILNLQELGYNDAQIKILERAAQMPNGAVLIAGPTGSGKTTTVASCLQLIKEHRKIYTIEEPVEKVVAHATQVPINAEHNDRGFAHLGRAALRMDPDVMVLGEMRDEATAQVMLRAALTGHLVFSTLHTNSATAIVTRLIDMDVSPLLLADSNVLLCLVCQRLVPTLCEHCAVDVDASELHKPHLDRWYAIFDEDLHQIKARGHDCEHCQGTGLSGRTIIAEVIWLDEQSREFIQQSNMLEWTKYLEQQGFANYQSQALQLIANGVCDPLDIEDIVGEINSNFSQAQFDYDDLY